MPAATAVTVPPNRRARRAPLTNALCGQWFAYASGLGEILQYTVESGKHDPTELRTIQDWLIAPRLNYWFFSIVFWFFDLSGVPRRLATWGMALTRFWTGWL